MATASAISTSNATAVIINDVRVSVATTVIITVTSFHPIQRSTSNTVRMILDN